ncbi:Branched-chain amino acid aminotransferase [hydrothermal vent metagenome]|uniref:branched-chain-amino-acid transaminase n=1 Tax=hydrothermal vent metagenome TaxID=652676 RepID=A0A3B0Y5X1_9ZZZZ
MPTEGICWINHRIVPLNEARISVMDHGLLYGDGVFEGIRFYADCAFLLESHLKRLAASAKAIALKLPVPITELTGIIQSLIDNYGSSQGYIRLIITRGKGPLGINPDSCRKPELIIIASPLQISDEQAQTRGIRAIIASTRRIPADCLSSQIKSLNYLNSILARIEANQAGAEEALLLNHQGFVAEGTVDNVFIVRNNVLYTPPTIDGALAGITRELIINLARNAGIKIGEKSLAAYDIYTADECFLSGTGAELIPVREVDGRELAACPGDFFIRISTLFRDYIEQGSSGVAQ